MMFKNDITTAQQAVDNADGIVSRHHSSLVIICHDFIERNATKQLLLYLQKKWRALGYILPYATIECWAYSKCQYIAHRVGE